MIPEEEGLDVWRPNELLAFGLSLQLFHHIQVKHRVKVVQEQDH